MRETIVCHECGEPIRCEDCTFGKWSWKDNMGIAIVVTLLLLAGAGLRGLFK